MREDEEKEQEEAGDGDGNLLYASGSALSKHGVIALGGARKAWKVRLRVSTRFETT